MELFPSVEWFRRLAERMDSKKYRRLGPVNLTLIVKIDFDHRSERYCLAFEGYRCATLRQIEREVIVNTLAATKGNQSEAARLLGLGESTLRYRLRKLGIVPFRRHARRPRAEEGCSSPSPGARTR